MALINPRERTRADNPAHPRPAEDGSTPEPPFDDAAAGPLHHEAVAPFDHDAVAPFDHGAVATVTGTDGDETGSAPTTPTAPSGRAIPSPRSPWTPPRPTLPRRGTWPPPELVRLGRAGQRWWTSFSTRTWQPWMTGVTLAVTWALIAWWAVRTGFNPTDEGLLLAQAQRLLGGQLPHLDFVTPRPSGAALLHVPELLAPTPLLLTSRVVALLEVLAFAVASVALISGTRVKRWGPGLTALAVIVFVVDLHTFPLMSWHTVDGLLVVALAMWALRAGVRERSAGLLATGALLAGYAPLIKQSFAAAPVLAVLWVVWQHRHGPNHLRPMSASQLAAPLTLVLVPPTLYLAWLIQGAGLDAAVDQLSAASGVSAFGGIGEPGFGLTALVVVAAGGLSLLGFWHGTLPREGQPRLLALGVAGALVVATVAEVVSGTLSLGGNWGQHLWWLALAAWLLAAAVTSPVQVAPPVVLALAWMSSLSWGYAVPNLVAGALVAVVAWSSRTVVVRLAPALDRPPLRRAAAASLAVMALVAVVAAVPARQGEVYRDVDAGHQVEGLGDLHGELAGVTAGPATVAFMGQVADCLDRYPSDRLAVVPDAPGAAVLLGRENPLPVDWWYPLELPPDRERLMADVQQVAVEGRYLVLFQTEPADGLWALDELATADEASPLFDYHDGMVDEVFAALPGEVVTCGSFVGRYAPPAPRATAADPAP
jgi:hypothetical protein